jgi:hypothetical protein
LSSFGDIFGSLLSSPVTTAIANNLTAKKPETPAKPTAPTALAQPSAASSLSAQLAALPIYGKVAIGVAVLAFGIIAVRLVSKR